jgi:hypothetical protein
MVFEIKDEKQSRKVLEFIISNDYDFDMGESANYIASKQKAEEHLEEILKIYKNNMEDEDMYRYYRYSEEQREDMHKYIIKSLTEIYMKAPHLGNNFVWYAMRNYFEKHSIK